MITIKNNRVVITIRGTHLVQERNPQTGVLFRNEVDCFTWVVASGWFDRLKQEAIRLLKERSTQKIHREAPAFKQLNAALGIYSAEENTRIVQAIEKYRAEVNSQEQTILNATSLEDIYAVLRSGQEFSHPANPVQAANNPAEAAN